MIRSHHQQHQLQRIETGLLRSDPQLTAMLGIFGKFSTGQAMPAWEQVPATRRDRIRQAVALTMQAITLAAAAIGLLLSAVLALLIVVVGTRHSHRLPAPGPERTRRSRGSDGRLDPAGQSLRPMSTSTSWPARRPRGVRAAHRLGERGHQRRVQIDSDQPAARAWRGVPGQLPGPLPGRVPRHANRPERPAAYPRPGR
jgi:hypothetical protein